jgi:hypothetical protein
MPQDTMGLGDLQQMTAGNVEATAAQKIRLQFNVIPKLTTTQRDALTGESLFAGLIIYNTTTNKLNVRAASAWEAVTSA